MFKLTGRRPDRPEKGVDPIITFVSVQVPLTQGEHSLVVYSGDTEVIAFLHGESSYLSVWSRGHIGE